MEFKTFTALGANGVPITLAQVTVFVAGTVTPVAIYDYAGNLVTQPGITDVNGQYGFRTAASLVDVKVLNPADSATYTMKEVLFQPPVRFKTDKFASAAGPFNLTFVPTGLFNFLDGDGAQIDDVSYSIAGTSPAQLSWVGGFDYTLFSNYRFRYAY